MQTMQTLTSRQFCTRWPILQKIQLVTESQNRYKQRFSDIQRHAVIQQSTPLTGISRWIYSSCKYQRQLSVVSVELDCCYVSNKVVVQVYIAGKTVMPSLSTSS